MLAASPLSPGAHTHLLLRRSPSFPPPLVSRFPRVPRICAASYASAAEREETAGYRRHHSRSHRAGHAEPAMASGTLYDVLGLSAGATSQEIKAAFRRLARERHPDVAAARRGEAASSAEEFMRIHAAYATLSDPGKRAEYDRRAISSAPRPIRRASSSSSYHYYPSPASFDASPPSVFPRRTWETDQCW